MSVTPPSERVQFGAAPAPAEKPAAPVRLWSARHGVPIAAVFATQDGSAVVSIDESNHARLWPTLDGKREPWVVPLTTPREVALVRDGDGFGLAALDVSGGMEIVHISGDGELTTHVKQAPDPGFDAAVATANGFLVLRRDQLLQQLDAHGAVKATLEPPPGEHVLKLLHRGDRTLALVRTKEGMRGHWLAGDPLAWGDETPKLAPVDLKRVFVSPDHERLVSFSNTRFEAIVVDLESGRSRPFASPNEMDYAAMGVPVGFAADGRIVFGLNDFELSTLEWWTPAQTKNAVLGGSMYALEMVSVDSAIVTDKNVIAFAGHEIAIATPNTVRSPSEVRFLGYRSPRAKAVKSTPLGAVVTVGGVASLLDDHVHVAMRMPAPDTIPITKDLALIKITPRDVGEPAVAVSNGVDPEWLEDPKPRPKPNRSSPRIALFDLVANKELQRWPIARAIRFEPATQLMAIDRGSKVVFARFDATARKLVDERTVTAAVTDVVLLDPALAAGNVAMLVRARGDVVEVRTLRDVAEPLPEPTQLTGKLEAVDRAGRIYLRVDADTIVVHGAASETRFTGMTGWKLRPSPSGTQVAAFARSRLMLLDERGQTVWSVGFPGVSDVTWTPGGALLALAGDVARLDSATGRVIAAQCGWGFGARSRRPEPIDVPSTTETLCDR